MAYDFTPPNTGATMSAQDAASIRELWQKTVDTNEQEEDFFGRFESRTGDKPVMVKTDLNKGRGQKITITVRSGYYGEGKSGDSHFLQPSDFEKTLIGSYDLSVDFLRHATSITDRTEEVMGMRGELKSGDAAEQGKWMGRQKTERMAMLLRERGGAENLMRAGGRSTDDDIISSDIFDYDEVLAMGARMRPLGGAPAMIGNYKGQKIRKFIVVMRDAAQFSLESDTAYQSLLDQAGVRGESNPLFAGGLIPLRGHAFSVWEDIDHDGRGPIGSPFNPKALLGEAIVAGTSAVEVKGGGEADAASDTSKLYFKHFYNYAYEFLPSDVLSAGSDEKYFLIVNPPNAPTDPNKIGMYAYTTGNNGNKITVTERLGPVDAGNQKQEVGSVTWNTGVWAGKHTQVHPVGATIVQCNAKGVPLGDTIMMGRMCTLRGYGKYRNLRTEQTEDGGMVFQRYITSVFGQSLRKDRLGRARGYVRLRHAIQYPGTPIPTNIT